VKSGYLFGHNYTVQTFCHTGIRISIVKFKVVPPSSLSVDYVNITKTGYRKTCHDSRAMTVKLTLYLTKHHAMKTYRGVEVAFLTPALFGSCHLHPR